MAELRSILWFLSLLLLVSFPGCQRGDPSAGQDHIEKKLFFFEGFPLHAMILSNAHDGGIIFFGKKDNNRLKIMKTDENGIVIF